MRSLIYFLIFYIVFGYLHGNILNRFSFQIQKKVIGKS